MRLKKPCKIWTGAKFDDGYGARTVNNRQWRVHRYAFFEATGIDPGEGKVLHHCDVRACYEPTHLYLGDHKQNMREPCERKSAMPDLPS